MSHYYRPPQGVYSVDNLKMAKELGYQTVFWSLAYVDWKQDQQPTEEYAMEKLTQRMTEAAKQQEAVEAFLAKIGRSRYREMLRLRFLSYLTIEEASARMGYSYDAGKRLSAQAMRAARAIWEACHAAQ